ASSRSHALRGNADRSAPRCKRDAERPKLHSTQSVERGRKSMKFGVCYYPEHCPEARWAEDARLLGKLGLKIIRLAEFAWAKMEPEPGVYDWDWLDRAIALFAEAGMEIILGTPTCTPPAWLTRQHPEILRVDANGRSRNHGTRRQYCP